MIFLIALALCCSITAANAKEVGSLTDLRHLINDTVTQDKVVVLDKDYTIDDTDDYKHYSEGIALRYFHDIIIDGQGHTIDLKHQHRLFHILEAKNILIKNVNVINGGGYESGFILSREPMTLINCTFKDAHAAFYAGAIECSQDLTLKDCKFINNNALWRKGLSKGGAIYCGKSISVSHCEFTNNVVKSPLAVWSKGGAIYCEGNAYVIDSKFSNNYAECGGAIYSEKGIKSYNNIFNKNIGDYGGCLYINEGTLSCNHCNFTDNKGYYYGGVIYGDDRKSLIDISYNNFVGSKSNKGFVAYTEGNYEKVYHNYYGTSNPNWDSGLLYEYVLLGKDVMHNDALAAVNPN